MTAPDRNVHTPMTPEQAMNNFRLFLELSPRNTYEQYRAGVRELAAICISLGIQDVNKKLLAALHRIQVQSNFSEMDGAFDLGELLLEINRIADEALAKA